MRILLIGGTGLLGYETAKILSSDNHEIISFALPPLSRHISIPKNMEIILKNYLELSDQELINYMKGCEGLIFAAGIDERVESKPPIYNLYYQYNIKPLERLLPLAKQAGIKSVVILGSYFSYFNQIWPELNLTKHHPYIRSRVDQEKLAFSYYQKDFNIAVVQIPYVFGTQKGREPVWTILVEQIVKMKRRTYWTGGGTTMMTAKQVGQAIVGALYHNSGANSYPLGYYNMKWPEILNIFHEALNLKERKTIIVPKFLYRIYARYLNWQNKKKDIETGLNLVKFSQLQYLNQFIDKDLASTKLGVVDDDIVSAMTESIILSKKVLDEKPKDIIKMKYK